MQNIIDRILNDVCLDERVDDGIFRIENPLHMDALREYMINKGIPEKMAIEQCNQIVEKGQHPERQAYNKDGLLVTFPTPKHKQDAITSGTHFEKDPTKKPPNVFGEPTPGQEQPTSDNTSSSDAPNQPAPPQAPAPVPEPPIKPDVPETPQEKQATAALIKQIIKSDDSILEEVSKWLEGNSPSYLKELFLK